MKKFQPGDRVVVIEREIRVEWTEEELRTTGVVKPGMPSKLNHGRPTAQELDDLLRVRAQAPRAAKPLCYGTVIEEFTVGVPPRGGLLRGTVDWKIQDAATGKDRVFPEDMILPLPEWELLEATRGLSAE